MRVRGLKHCLSVVGAAGIESHPMRVRGLKRLSNRDWVSLKTVAPHAGAWIET